MEQLEKIHLMIEAEITTHAELKATLTPENIRGYLQEKLRDSVTVISVEIKSD